jgi:hypothetical protein
MIGDTNPSGTPVLEFRLTFEGTIASGASASSKHKQDIRRVFHKQLSNLWWTNPLFSRSGAWGGKFLGVKNPDGSDARTRVDELAGYYKRGEYRFVPIVFDEMRMMVSIDILFLRPGSPGSVIQGADIDNRMKTLFDALKVPEGIVGSPGPGETPFFVLLEDDRLITRVSVETDQLLEPTHPDAGKLDARLVLTVNLTPYVRLHGTMGF